MLTLAFRTETRPVCTRQQERCMQLMLRRALGSSRLDRLVHLKIMRQAHAHAAQYTDEASSQGAGGDLFFVLNCYRHLFAYARVMG